MKRPIAIGLAPNLETDDIFLAIKNIFNGSLFFQNEQVLEKLTFWFKKQYLYSHTFFFNSARSALYLSLKAVGIGINDEVIVQAFSCVAVPNSVLWAGAKPVYVDILRDNLGIDPNDLEKKINKRTKAIIIQHTFGIPAKITSLLKIAKKHNLIVIEDCAHIIGEKLQNRYIGSFADLTVYSFGRDKAISSVFGGLLVVNNSLYAKQIYDEYQKLEYPSKLWVFKQLLHSVLMLFVLPLYDFFGLGKFILFLFQKLNLLTLPVYNEEKSGYKPEDFPKKMPTALALLLLNQVQKIQRYNSQRNKIVKIYNRIFKNNLINCGEFPLLRYPLLVNNREEVINDAKKEKIYLGKWYSNTIDPEGVDCTKIRYTDCPTAEYVAQHIVNLPTYPTLQSNDIAKILNFVENIDYIKR